MLKRTSDLGYKTTDLMLYVQLLKNGLNIAVGLLMYLNKMILAPLFGISDLLDLHQYTCNVLYTVLSGSCVKLVFQHVYMCTVL